MKRVAILGCGPTGLMVAHAAELSGWDFYIMSRKQPSRLYGAQYLHQAIPNLDCGTPKMVRYTLNGSAEAYRRKVYGDDWDGTVSPEDFVETHAAWDIREAYEHLWRGYSEEIYDVNIERSWAHWNGWMQPNTDLVISTIPRKLWGYHDQFESIKVWALGDTEMPRVEPPYRPGEFTVICEAAWRIPWYRISNIFGYCTIEWPWREYFDVPPHAGASIVEKPLRHHSTAAADFVHLGRYGAWQKGVLTSDAFFEAMKVFANDRS